jgi:hypothetical protein
MPQIEVRAETLAKIRGGLIAAMLNRYLERMEQDCKASPDIKEKRVVNLKIELSPVMQDMQLSYVDYQFSIGEKAPSRAAGLRASIRYQNGKQRILFEEDSQDNPDQASLLDSQESGE